MTFVGALLSVHPFGKHQYRLPVAPGEDAFGGLVPGHPFGGEVLAGREAHRHPPGQLEAEYMLGIPRDARRIAMPPFRIDFVDVLKFPVFEHMTARVDPGFLGDFTDRRVAQRFSLVLASRDRLPESRVVGALEQQHLELPGMDHDERRDRDLGGHATRMREETSPVPLNHACGMSRERCFASGVPAPSTAMMPMSAAKSRCRRSRMSVIARSSEAPRSIASEIARAASVRITNSPVPVADAATLRDA